MALCERTLLQRNIFVYRCKEVVGVCSGHKCRNTKGHFKCECNEGYELSEHSSCKAKGNRKGLVFAHRLDIRYLDLMHPNDNYKALYNGLRSTVALDYNIKQNYLVWSDVAEEKIYIGALNKSEGKPRR